MKRAITLLNAAGVLLFLGTASAHAHEPLWGETAQTFAFGVLHPEVRFGWGSESQLFQGSKRVPNTNGHRMTHEEAHFSLQYARDTNLNLRLEAPFVRVRSEVRDNGIKRSAGVSGWGDLMLSAKNRFRTDFGADWKTMHAYTVGLQLPTGKNNGRGPGGERLLPSEQPGTGNWGVMLGYAYAHERLQDTVWASAMYLKDVTGSERKGDLLTLDVAYGYWTRRAYQPEDLGIILAAGPHFAWMGRDRVSSPTTEDSGNRLFGLQTTLIATKGQYQGRLGVLVPVYQHYNGTQLGTAVQWRAGVEALF